MKRSSHQTHPPATSSRPPSAEAGGPTSSAVEANAAFDLAADSDSDGEASNHLPGSSVELGTQRDTEDTEHPDNTDSKTRHVIRICAVCVPNEALSVSQTEAAERIIRSRPASGGRPLHEELFALARALRGVGSDPHAFESHVKQWHAAGWERGVIRDAFLKTWIDFLRAWGKVKFPRGSGTMSVLMERVKAGRLPKCAERYDWPELRLLIGLCRELQREADSKPFFLSCRTAADELGVSRMDAWRMFYLLLDQGVLEKVLDAKGRRATEYRYRGDWEEPAGPAPATAGPGSEILL